MRSMLRSLALLSGCLFLSACGAAPPKVEPTSVASPAVDPAQRDWDAFVERYIEARFVRDPGSAAYQGRHEFDGQVADLSLAAHDENAAELRTFREQALAFDASQLSEEQRFERDYLVANIDGALFWLVRAEQHRKSPLVYSSAIDPSLYLTRAYAPLDKRMRAYVKHLGHVPRVVRQMKENLRLPMPRTFVEVGLQVFAGMGPYLQNDVPSLFASVEEPALQAELRTATQAAVAATEDAKAFLEAQRESANDSFALGSELFREMLWATERVDTPLDELERIGQRDLEDNLAALTSACAAVAPKQPIADCIRIVTSEKPQAGPVQGARDQLTSLKAFLEANDLVTIPGPEEALVEEAPPYKRWNQAYIEIPGPYEQNMPSIYYIAPPDPAWSQADKLAYIPGAADLLFISVHEVWPGHFLQFLHANRAGRMYGRLYVGYAFAEGWAHYTEELMWDAGLHNDDPKVRVGQLLNALLRNARFLSAIGLHTRGMTVAESEKLFLEKAYQDPGNAKQQAARGTFDPAYLNYTLGKLMIRKMREDFAASRGGRAAWRAFHDQLLSYGGPPLPLVQKAMLGEGKSLL
jgi:uncharacterized protein (DUF885 family)